MGVLKGWGRGLNGGGGVEGWRESTSIQYGSILDGLRHVVEREGVRGLWRGGLVRALNGGVSCGVMMCAYSRLKNEFTCMDRIRARDLWMMRRSETIPLQGKLQSWSSDQSWEMEQMLLEQDHSFASDDSLQDQKHSFGLESN